MAMEFRGMATGGRKLEELSRQMSQMEADGVSGEHMKAMWEGKSNILVAVRVRPILKHDMSKKSCIRVLDSKVVVIMDPASGDKLDVLRANRSREKHYAFDYVFEPGSSQDAVYNHSTKFLIHGVLDGYNATVFAYGNTGAGKTFTMLGSKTDPGIMVRVMNDLFQYSVKQSKKEAVIFTVTVSFLEVIASQTTVVYIYSRFTQILFTVSRSTMRISEIYSVM
jgi:kinesin family protein 18/19